MPVTIRAKPGQMHNGKEGAKPHSPCPFGCTPGGQDPVNEWGWCSHLVGWTLDKEVMNLRECQPSTYDSEPDRESSALVVPIEEADVIAEGPSAYTRVYRSNGKAPYKKGEYSVGDRIVKPMKSKEQALQEEAAAKERENALLRKQLEELSRVNKELAEAKKPKA